MYEIFAELLEKNKKRAIDVSRATGVSPTTLSDWKSGKSTPKQDKLQKIADYFGVTIEYLMTGREDSAAQKITSLSRQEELDIMEDVDVIINKLKNGEEVVLRFNGDTAGDEDLELLKNSLLNMCMTAKRMSKQKE
jgi:transcriptional regulator with XRE-family HTH domain